MTSAVPRTGADPPWSSPLSATLRTLPQPERLTVVDGVPAGEAGWIGAADLARAEVLDPLLTRVDAQVRALVPDSRGAEVRTVVAPAYVLEWYLWAVTSAAALPFVHARRVPRLDADRLALRLAPGGWPEAVAVLAPQFSCLADDPDAGHPHARPVADLEALRATLRAEVAGHAETFLAAWGRRGRRGRQALWAVVTDMLVEAVQGCAPGGRGAREAEELLPKRLGDRLAPFVGPALYIGTGRPGAPAEPFRRRVSCCLAYSVPGARACFSCPRLDDTERTCRLTGG